MNQPKNSAFAIGAFIVGAIALAVAALLFFSGGRMFTQKERVVMYFEGTVQGLQIGAPVKLKGVILGEVTDIQINFQNYDKKITTPQTIITAVTADLVLERINREGEDEKEGFFNEAIENGLRAQLNFQSFLTGLLYVELDFYPKTPVKLYALQTKHLELPTIATEFEELTKSLQELHLKELAKNFTHLLTQVNTIVGSGEIEKMFASVSRAATSIEITSNNANREIIHLSKNLEKTRGQLDTLLAQLNTQTPQVAQSLNTSMQEFNRSLAQLNKTTATINETFSDDAPLVSQLTNTLEDISRSAQAFRNLSETLDQQPEALLRGKTSLMETKEK